MFTGLAGLGRKKLGRRSGEIGLFLSDGMLQSNPSLSSPPPPPPLSLPSSEGEPVPDVVVARVKVWKTMGKINSLWYH